MSIKKAIQYILLKNHAPVLTQNVLIKVIVLFCVNLEGIKLMYDLKTSREKRERLKKTKECFFNFEYFLVTQSENLLTLQI